MIFPYFVSIFLRPVKTKTSPNTNNIVANSVAGGCNGTLPNGGPDVSARDCLKMVKLRRKAMNRDNMVSIEPTNTLHGMGFSLFNNPTPSNLLQPSRQSLP